MNAEECGLGSHDAPIESPRATVDFRGGVSGSRLYLLSAPGLCRMAASPAACLSDHITGCCAVSLRSPAASRPSLTDIGCAGEAAATESSSGRRRGRLHRLLHRLPSVPPVCVAPASPASVVARADLRCAAASADRCIVSERRLWGTHAHRVRRFHCTRDCDKTSVHARARSASL
jgi:hypothetical protein